MSGWAFFGGCVVLSVAVVLVADAISVGLTRIAEALRQVADSIRRSAR